MTQVGGIDVNVRDAYGVPSLCRAAESGSPGGLNLLLSVPGIALEATRENDQRTALQVATNLGDIAAVRTLLDKGVELNYGLQTSGWTALMMATNRQVILSLYTVDIGSE